MDFLAIGLLLLLAGEGHAEELEQLLRFLVGLCRRHDADLQPAQTVHLVVVDLREGQLLPQAEGIVPAAVEGAGRDTPEVTDAGQRERRQALQEVPHALPAQRHLDPDGVVRAQPGRRDLVDVALPEAAAHAFTSRATGCPQCPQTRTLLPFSGRSCLMRVGRLQAGQTSMTLLARSGWAISRMPPCWTRGARSLRPWRERGLVCRLAMLRPSTTRRSGRTMRSTVPRLPESFPVSTTTSSPLRISGTLVTRGAGRWAGTTAPPARAR